VSSTLQTDCFLSHALHDSLPGAECWHIQCLSSGTMAVTVVSVDSYVVSSPTGVRPEWTCGWSVAFIASLRHQAVGTLVYQMKPKFTPIFMPVSDCACVCVCRVMFWLAVLLAAVVVIHMAILAAFLFSRWKTPSLLHFPRPELLVLLIALAAIAQGAASRSTCLHHCLITPSCCHTTIQLESTWNWISKYAFQQSLRHCGHHKVRCVAMHDWSAKACIRFNSICLSLDKGVS